MVDLSLASYSSRRMAERAAEKRRTRHEKRKREEERKWEAEEEAVHALDAFLSVHTLRCAGGVIPEREFNARLRDEQVEVSNVRGKMERKGVQRAFRRLEGVNTKVFVGIEWNT